MGRAPCCAKVGLHRGPWTPREDTLLVNYIQAHGEGQWRNLPKKAGLLRCGKSCRLRWMNYLRPDIKRGNVTPAEEDLIMRLHSLLGNRWSLIAGRLPGRTDNEIKNYWNTHLSKKLRGQGTNPRPHEGMTEAQQLAGTKRRKVAKPTSQPRRQRRGATVKIHGTGSRGEKPKVHLPKATRLTSAFPLPKKDRYGSNIASGSTPCTCNQGSGQMDREETQAPWTAYDNDVVQEGNRSKSRSGQGVELVKGMECPRREEEKDQGGLEKLYEEYLELLRVGDGLDQDHLAELDCFAESLLI